MLLDNRPEFLELAEAARLAGLYFTPLSIHLRPHEVGYVLADSGAAAAGRQPGAGRSGRRAGRRRARWGTG